MAKLDENDSRKKTALVKHAYIQQHLVDWQSSKILHIEIDFEKRRFLESLFICLECVHWKPQ